MKTLNGILSRTSFGILCALLAYAVFWGVGNPLSIGGLSVWTILLCLLGVFAAIPALVNIRQICKSTYFWILITFGIWVAICTVRGFLAGNDQAIIIRDLSGLLYFVFFPIIFVVLNDCKRVQTVMKVMMYAALAMAVLQFASFVEYLTKPEQFAPVKDFFVRINYLNYTRISETIPRLLFVCMPFQLCGCAFAIYFQLIEKRFRVHYACITGVCLNAMVLSFTRALYLSAGMAALSIVSIYLIFFKIEERRKLGVHVAAAVGALLLSIGVLGVLGETNYLGYAVKRALVGVENVELQLQSTEPTVDTVTNSTEGEPTVDSQPSETKPVADQEAEAYLNATTVSDQYRIAIRNELMGWIRKSPVIGNGVGLTMELKKDWPEYSYLDLMAKTGIVGLMLYFMPMLLMGISILRDYIHGKQRTLSVAWFAVMVGLMGYSIFQPYLNNVQCIFVYCCTLCAHSAECSRSTN